MKKVNKNNQTSSLRKRQRDFFTAAGKLTNKQKTIDQILVEKKELKLFWEKKTKKTSWDDLNQTLLDVDWDYVRWSFKREDVRVQELINDISKKIPKGRKQGRTPYLVELTYIDSKTEYFIIPIFIKWQFLRFLTIYGLIKEVSTEEKMKNDQSYVVARFFVINPYTFNKRAAKLARVFVSERPEINFDDQKKIEIRKGKIFWQFKHIHFGAGEGAVMATFLENATEYFNNKLEREGRPILKSELEVVGGYSDEQSFRDALKRIRSKIIKNRMPIKIRPIKNEGYLMEIRRP